jgi:hypothetical protein
MKRAIIFAFFIYLLVVGEEAAAKPRRIESIPFEMVGSYVIIKARINDSSVLNLIVDSGIRNTIITELMEGDNISLNYSDVKELMGLGGGEHLEAYASNSNTLKVGKLKLDYKTVYVLKNDVFNLSKHTGTKINGLIGVDFFQHHVVEIDYTHKRIRFYDPETMSLPNGYGMLPITIEGQKMFVELSLQKPDTASKRVKMLIDTGAELNAWFQTSTKESINVPEKWVQGTIGEGFNGIITGKYAHIPQLCFGDFCLKNPIVSFPDSSSINGIISVSRRDGTIGSQLLSRFNLFFDYIQQKIYFKPNENFNNKFVYNVAGIEIVQIAQMINLCEVLDVWSKSPAEKAGVQRGDQIIEINGVRAFEMTVGEIRKIFETSSRRPLRMTLMRKDKQISVEIDMKDKI